jgi:hypothetical protein
MLYAEAGKKNNHMNPSVKDDLKTVPRSCRLEPGGETLTEEETRTGEFKVYLSKET